MLRLLVSCLLAVLLFSATLGISPAADVASTMKKCFLNGERVRCDIAGTVPDLVELNTEGVFLIKDGHGNVVTRIADVKFTGIQGFTRSTTAWALQFDVRNVTQSSNNPGLQVDFYTPNGFPMPGNRLVVRSFRDHCYYVPENIRKYQGTFQMPYADFVKLVGGMELTYLAGRGSQGLC